MSYGDFTAQITARGASAIKRSRETNTTTFAYKEQAWKCSFKNQPAMTNDLADGCEMDYCLAEYCEKTVLAEADPEPEKDS